MAITLSGSTGVTYPNGGVDNVAGAGVGTTDSQTLTNKTLTTPTLTTPNIDSAQFATVSGTAPIYPCRSWVNFNGTGTVAIRASGNVSSITDNGTGNYTINFTTNLTDVNFATTGTAHDVNNSSKPRFVGSYAKTTGSCSIAVSYLDNFLIDAINVEIAIFR